MPNPFALCVENRTKDSPPENCIGYLDIDGGGTATFFDATEKLVATLSRARLERSGSHGLSLSGMEPDGFDRKGIPKYKYQSWFLRYSELLKTNLAD